MGQSPLISTDGLPLSTNYSPPQGSVPDPWLTDPKLSTLTSTQVSGVHLPSTGAGASNDNNYTMSSTSTPLLAPQKDGVHDVHHQLASKYGITPKGPQNLGLTPTPNINLNVNPEANPSFPKLNGKMTITVDTCKIGVSDRLSRLVSFQPNSAEVSSHSVEMVEDPLQQPRPVNPPSPTGILAGAQLLNANPVMPRQAYFARILPQGLDMWRSYRGAAQKSAFCKIRAAFIRDMANKRRFPQWSVGITPPPGIVTTPIGAMKLVTTRRQCATSGMNTVASILDDRAADYSTTADSHREGLRRHYEQQQNLNVEDAPYDFAAATDLAMKLIERESATLTQKLEAEKARLKRCPEAALWIGIPVSLVPANIRAVNLNPAPTTATGNNPTVPLSTQNRKAQPSAALGRAPSALFSDAIQLPPPARPNTARDGLNHVSPLSVVAPLNPNQVFSTAWGRSARNPPPRKQQKRKQSSRPAPYQAPQENVPPQVLAQQIPAPNDNSVTFRQRRRRQGNNNNQPRSTNAQQVQLSGDQIKLLQDLLKGLGH